LILIVVDVTKISNDPKIKSKIEDKIQDYVYKGGNLLGAHDIIYRRTRNSKLQKMFGCRLNEFVRIENKKVKYKLNQKYNGHIIAKNLPYEFELKDGEVLTGKWANKAEFIYLWGDSEVPLVVTREYGRGKLVWINSGDMYEDDQPPESLIEPEEHLCALLINIIRWFEGK